MPCGVRGSGSTKPRIPCRKGRFPVAMEVQRIGESAGASVETSLRVPASMSRLRLGILPASISGSAIFQSAASQPIRTTFGECDCVIMCFRECCQRSRAAMDCGLSRRHSDWSDLQISGLRRRAISAESYFRRQEWRLWGVAGLCGDGGSGQVRQHRLRGVRARMVQERLHWSRLERHRRRWCCQQCTPSPEC